MANLPPAISRSPYNFLTVTNLQTDAHEPLVPDGTDTINNVAYDPANPFTIPPTNSLTLQSNGVDGWFSTQNAIDAVRWVGERSDSRTYYKDEMVFDNRWLAVANKETTQPAAPFPSGTSEYIYGDTPAWLNAATVVPQVITGHQYTFNEAVSISQARVWCPTSSSLHPNRIYELVTVNRSDPLNIVTTRYGQFVPTSIGWYVAGSTTRLLTAGSIVDFLLTVTDTSTETVYNLNYDYLVPNNETIPLAGEIVHSNKAIGQLWVNKTDNTGDQSAD